MFDVPLFPLNTVLFPGMPIQLHIFEPRYRLMIRHCLDTNRPFGVVLIRQGMEALGPLPDPYKVGCTARIVDVEPLENGTMNLTAIGDERFRILELLNDQEYLMGKVELLLLEHPQTIELSRARRLFMQEVRAYLKILYQIDSSEIDLNEIQFPDDPLMLIHLAASLLQVPAVEKQPILSALNAKEMLHIVRRLYKRETAVLTKLIGISESAAERAAWLN